MARNTKTDPVHDLGFLFWSTWKRWYDLTQDLRSNEEVIEAGEDAGAALQREGRYLRSFVADGLFIIWTL